MFGSVYLLETFQTLGKEVSLRVSSDFKDKRNKWALTLFANNFFFNSGILSHIPNNSDCESFTVLFFFIYLIEIGFAEVENWQEVWKLN